MNDKLTAHQRVMRAYYDGTGLRLSRLEVMQLGEDDSISYVAVGDCQDDDRCEVCIRKRCVCEFGGHR